jgi:molybdenum cofactor cytidylyltransferase
MIKAILLAAGKSKRLKSENKLIKIYNKKPLINHGVKSLIKSKVNKIIIVLGFESEKLKKIIKKNRKISFTFNKYYKKGMSSSIKQGLKKISKKDKGFIIVQSDMPFITTSNINKICNSITAKKYLIHILRYKNQMGNPIGFDISILDKFKKIKGNIGAKYMVKKLKNRANFIAVSSKKFFKDLDKPSDFRN